MNAGEHPRSKPAAWIEQLNANAQGPAVGLGCWQDGGDAPGKDLARKGCQIGGHRLSDLYVGGLRLRDGRREPDGR